MTIINMERFQSLSIQKAILSYPHLMEKQPLDNKYVTEEEKRKYVATFILDKTIVNSKGEVLPNPVVETIRERVEELKTISKLKNIPHEVIKDGDEEYDNEEDVEKKKKKEYLRGKYIITAKNSREVKLFVKIDGLATLTSKVENINNTDLFYPGAIVNAHIELAAWPYKEGEKKKGIAVKLHSVQFSKHGKMIGGGTSNTTASASIFDSINDEEDSDFAPTSKFNVEDEPF